MNAIVAMQVIHFFARLWESWCTAETSREHQEVSCHCYVLMCVSVCQDGDEKHNHRNRIKWLKRQLRFPKNEMPLYGLIGWIEKKRMLQLRAIVFKYFLIRNISNLASSWGWFTLVKCRMKQKPRQYNYFCWPRFDEGHNTDCRGIPYDGSAAQRASNVDWARRRINKDREECTGTGIVSSNNLN